MAILDRLLDVSAQRGAYLTLGLRARTRVQKRREATALLLLASLLLWRGAKGNDWVAIFVLNAIEFSFGSHSFFSHSSFSMRIYKRFNIDLTIDLSNSDEGRL